jgi:trigger factor
MQVQTKKIGDNMCEIHIVMNKIDVDNEVESIAQQMQPQAQVKGFRKGQAPVSLIKSQYIKQIRQEVSTRLLYSGTSDALKNRELRNISNPELLIEYRPQEKKPYVGKFNLDGSFEFAVSVELPPEISVSGYKGVEVEAVPEDFEGWFKTKIREQQIMYGEKEEAERPAKLGDELVIDFESFLDDQSIGGGKEENYRLILGEYSLLKEFEDSFIGRLVNQKFSTTVEFPPNYPNKEIAGKSCKFDCKIHEVNELTPHDLDDVLAQMLSYDDVDDMMKGYQGLFEKEFRAPLRLQIFNSIMEKLLEQHQFEVPRNWIDREVENTKSRLNIKDVDNNPQALNSIIEMSERNVKIAYILDKIYALEKDIHLTVEEFKSIAEKEGQKAGLSGTELIERLKAAGSYEGLVAFHEQQKVMSFLIDHAIIREKAAA